MIFQQMLEAETSTYTYIVADHESLDAVIIDSVRETAQRDLKLLQELRLNLRYILDTHIHADHVTGAAILRDATGAQTAVSAAAGVKCADINLEDGQELKVGRWTLRALATPGHTDSCMSFYIRRMVFTGDALLIRGTGRTDFQQGSSVRLYQSIHKKLFTLPPETVVYPGHDYKGFTSSSIEAEMAHNPRVGGRSEAEFVKIRAELKLADPKKIAESVPANLVCGRT